jgi:hypothetical protein
MEKPKKIIMNIETFQSGVRFSFLFYLSFLFSFFEHIIRSPDSGIGVELSSIFEIRTSSSIQADIILPGPPISWAFTLVSQSESCAAAALLHTLFPL